MRPAQAQQGLAMICAAGCEFERRRWERQSPKLADRTSPAQLCRQLKHSSSGKHKGRRPGSALACSGGESGQAASQEFNEPSDTRQCAQVCTRLQSKAEVIETEGGGWQVHGRIAVSHVHGLQQSSATGCLPQLKLTQLPPCQGRDRSGIGLRRLQACAPSAPSWPR